MIWLDIKYANLLSHMLDKYKVQSHLPFKAVCRCPICGDSKKSKTKTRGYLIQKDDILWFFCHNCAEGSMSFGKLLERLNSSLYAEYLKERYIEDPPKHKKQEPDTNQYDTKVSFKKTDIVLRSLKKISQLDPTHPAKLYVVSRKIPTPYHAKLFYAPRFKEFVNTVLPGKFTDINKDEPRLIIPLINKLGVVFGFQGRSFAKDGIRYITIMLDENNPKIYNYETVDLKKDVYMFEGPIDSMFLSNSVAMVGASVDLTDTGLNKDNVIKIYDNEPRNKNIVRFVEKALEEGFRVCIWDGDLKYKDVNDMILGGMSPQQVKQMIDERTFSGLSGVLMLNEWKKN